MNNRQFLKACRDFDDWVRREKDDLRTGVALWQALNTFIEQGSIAAPAFDFESAISNFANSIEEWRKLHSALFEECNEPPDSDDERIYAYPV
jgi:hypothetical protein